MPNLIKLIGMIKNCFYGDYSYIRKETKLKNYPRLFAIEVTNYCNLECIMCPYPSMTRKKGFMDISLFHKIVDEISQYTDFVWLHNFGDPLLHRRLIEMIEYCNEKGVKAGFSTNATLLTQDISNKLLDTNLFCIILSIDAASKETYEKIRKTSDYEKTIANVISFLEMKKIKKSKVRTYVQLIRMKENIKEIDDFISMWKNYDVEIIIKNFDTWGGALNESKPIFNEEYLWGCDKNRYPCRMIWHRLIVLWDGTVTLCERDYDAKLPLGDMTNDSLFEIWNSDKMVDLRRKQILGDFNNGLCNNCREYEGFPQTIKHLLNVKKGEYIQILYRLIPIKYTPSNLKFLLNRKKTHITIWKNK